MYQVADKKGIVKGNFACFSYAQEFIDNLKYSKEYKETTESFITRRKIDLDSLSVWDNDGKIDFN